MLHIGNKRSDSKPITLEVEEGPSFIRPVLLQDETCTCTIHAVFGRVKLEALFSYVTEVKLSDNCIL